MSTVDGAARGRTDEPPPVHVRVRHRGAPGQDLRPDQRRDPRRDAGARPPLPRRRGDPGHHRSGPRGRRGDHRGLRRDPPCGPRHHPADRLRLLRQGLRRLLLRRLGVHRSAVPRHRPGCRQGARAADHRRRGPAGRPGRRRPGPDVRLRLRRHPGAHAAADRAGAPAVGPPQRGPQEQRARLPAPRRQDPGDHRLRRHHPRRHRHRRAVHPARCGHLAGEHADARHRVPRHPSCAGGRRAGDLGHADPGQPHRPLRDRRPDG